MPSLMTRKDEGFFKAVSKRIPHPVWSFFENNWEILAAGLGIGVVMGIAAAAWPLFSTVAITAFIATTVFAPVFAAIGATSVPAVIAVIFATAAVASMLTGFIGKGIRNGLSAISQRIHAMYDWLNMVDNWLDAIDNFPPSYIVDHESLGNSQTVALDDDGEDKDLSDSNVDQHFQENTSNRTSDIQVNSVDAQPSALSRKNSRSSCSSLGSADLLQSTLLSKQNQHQSAGFRRSNSSDSFFSSSAASDGYTDGQNEALDSVGKSTLP